jgi:hypothetical protein
MKVRNVKRKTKERTLTEKNRKKNKSVQDRERLKKIKEIKNYTEES